MSANARPEIRAYEELETLVRHLGEELASFRRRALGAEAQLREAGHAAAPKGKGAADRIEELEKENAQLRTRVGRAEDRVRQMLERLRFLRQQIQASGTTGVAR